MTSTCVTSSTTKGRATPLKGVTGPYGKTTPTMWYGSTQDCDACAWPTRGAPRSRTQVCCCAPPGVASHGRPRQ